MDRFPMTAAGRDRLKDELEHLKKVERPRISAAIEVARAHGDLKENAEYHAEKDKQGMSEARIRTIETKLALAQIVDPEKLAGSRASFGATVRLLDLDSDEELTYSLVGDEEANTKHGLLYFKTPIGQALMGKEEGDDVVVKIPNGVDRSFEILEIDFEAIKLAPIEE